MSAVLLVSVAAHADTVIYSGATVNLSQAGVPDPDTLVFGATTSTIVSPGVVKQSGSYHAGYNPGVFTTVPFSFTEDITVGGITHTLTFTGSDTLTQTGNTIVLNALGPVAFGATTLNFQGFSALATDQSTQIYQLTATVTPFVEPVPEPSTLLMCGTGVLAAAGAMRRKLRIA